jgi:type I restriction enzyme R subunit
MYADFLEKYQKGQELKAKADELEKNKLQPERRKVTALEKKIKALDPNKDETPQQKEQLESELKKLKISVASLNEEKELLLKETINNTKAKDQEKRIKHIRGIFNTETKEYQEEQDQLIQNLISGLSGEQSTPQVKNEIRDYLLGYVWNKSNEKSDLKKYLDVMKKEQLIKAALYGVLQNVDEVERVFAVLAAQPEY